MPRIRGPRHETGDKHAEVRTQLSIPTIEADTYALEEMMGVLRTREEIMWAPHTFLLVKLFG
jgi:hypothetical protein